MPRKFFPIFGYGAIYEKVPFFTDFLVRTPKKVSGSRTHNFDATDLPNLNGYTPNISGGGLKVDLVSPVWPPALSKVSLSEKLSMILGVFFVDKISFPCQTVHFAIACHTYSESYCSSR